MAAANKPTGVHVSLIIFVMATLIFGVMWYLEMGERKTAVADTTKAKSEFAAAKSALQNRDDDLTAILQLLGIEMPIDKVGRDSPPDETATVLGQMREDIAKFAKDLSQPTIRRTLAEMSTKLNTLTQEKNNVQAQLNDSQSKVLSLEKEMQARVDQFDQNAKSETARAEKANVALEETVKSKNQTIDALNRSLQEERVRAEADLDRLQKQIDGLSKDIAGLTVANNKLQDELQAARQYSFEVPDGEIRWVDSALKLVWINLGEADRLPKKTSFSVYTKAHHGVARGNEDVKGAIEVTRILGPHLAEAKILQSDDFRPVAVGDPIYSPLWSAGKIEYFALLGKFDFDGDGRDDRGRLHEMINASGAKIESEVDDMGILHGPGVTVRTRFLVIGEIPDPLKTELTPDEVDAAKKMMDLDKSLKEQARQQGVRWVSMNDFLNYIGYTSTRRMWAPGEDIQYNLKRDAVPLGIDEVVKERMRGTRTSKNFTGRGARKLEEQQKNSEKSNPAEGSGASENEEQK